MSSQIFVVSTHSPISEGWLVASTPSEPKVVAREFLPDLQGEGATMPEDMPESEMDRKVAEAVLRTLDDEQMLNLTRRLLDKGILAPAQVTQVRPFTAAMPVQPMMAQPVMALGTMGCQAVLPPGVLAAPNTVMPCGPPVALTAMPTAAAVALPVVHVVPPSAQQSPAEVPALTESSVDENAAASPETQSQGGIDTETTLILRNFPATFDQTVSKQWLDDGGFADQYDFFLWFPAKASSRLNSCSYAFVNFRTAEIARRFRSEKHLTRFPSEPDTEKQLPLSVAYAKVQGFSANYARFGHLLTGETATKCEPFFASDAIAALSAEEREQGLQVVAEGPATEDNTPQTTLAIRNLPPSILTQEAAMEWFNGIEGVGGLYDFFLFLPAKRQSSKPARGSKASSVSGSQGSGYAFVNFTSASTAETYMNGLNGKRLSEEDPELNIVYARVQGLSRCLEHFATLFSSGRLSPWVDQAMLSKTFQ